MIPAPDLLQRLAVARQAAVEGARMLREEFHRPEGPRGYGDHADIDEEVETAIRKHLAAAFPGDGFLGEETGYHTLGSQSPVGGGAVWVVDPNDGTSTFLKGFRGSAVSIALVAQGRPVLGVVHAWEGEGEEICWCEGSPLLHRGKPVERTWPESLANCGHALLSHVADRKSVMNSHCAAPLRYRTLPSIAMRMALVAVGDGDLTVSLGGPMSWDMAAGHALLRGAGGSVVNGQGQPFTYDTQGHCNSDGRLFAGAPALLEWLRTRPWNQVPEAPAEPGAPDLAWPRPARSDRRRPDPGPLSRAQGCLLGQVAGDSLGSLVEFQDATRIRERYPTGLRDLADGGVFNLIAGQPTDDSELAWMLARSLVQQGDFLPGEVLRNYHYWRDSHPFDMGHTTRRALNGHPDPLSEANGSLMRISPLGVFGANLDESHLDRLALEDGRLTHPHPVCGQAGSLLARAIALAVREGVGPEALYRRTLEWAGKPGMDARLAERLTCPDNASREEFSGQGAGWVLLCLQNAFWQLRHAGSFEEALVDTVGRGGDTDTNAAVTGALLGAVHGRSAIPERWQRAILSCRPLKHESLPWIHQARPRAFWPVDVLVLAERLLAG
jgi:ADP-ribosyl-[dinitrogen reductase] hydrolase